MKVFTNILILLAVSCGQDNEETPISSKVSTETATEQFLNEFNPDELNVSNSYQGVWTSSDLSGDSTEFSAQGYWIFKDSKLYIAAICKSKINGTDVLAYGSTPLTILNDQFIKRQGNYVDSKVEKNGVKCNAYIRENEIIFDYELLNSNSLSIKAESENNPITFNRVFASDLQ